MKEGIIRKWKSNSISTTGFENGYFMGKYGSPAWENTSPEYKEGYKEGEASYYHCIGMDKYLEGEK